MQTLTTNDSTEYRLLDGKLQERIDSPLGDDEEWMHVYSPVVGSWASHSIQAAVKEYLK